MFKKEVILGHYVVGYHEDFVKNYKEIVVNDGTMEYEQVIAFVDGSLEYVWAGDDGKLYRYQGDFEFSPIEEEDVIVVDADVLERAVASVQLAEKELEEFVQSLGFKSCYDVEFNEVTVSWLVDVPIFKDEGGLMKYLEWASKFSKLFSEKIREIEEKYGVVWAGWSGN